MNTLINPNSSIPMYKASYSIYQRINLKKNLQPGDKIPSEAELVKSLESVALLFALQLQKWLKKVYLHVLKVKELSFLFHKKILLMQMTVLDSLNLVKWQEKKRLLKF